MILKPDGNYFDWVTFCVNFLLDGSMKYVLLLVFILLMGCSVHRDTARSVNAYSTETLVLDALDVREESIVLDHIRLFRGGYIIRENWKVFDTAAPQLPDGSFPVLAEGSSEKRGDLEETEQANEVTQARDSAELSINRIDKDSYQETDKTRMDGKTDMSWLKMVLLGFVIGLIIFFIVKYGKKN